MESMLQNYSFQFEKVYSERKKANVASAVGGAKVGTSKLEGHVAL